MHPSHDILATDRAGRMTWTIRDPAFEGTGVTLEVVPMAWAIGMALRLAAEGTLPDDRLVWANGSTVAGRDEWNFNAADQKQWFTEGFVPEECRRMFRKK